MSDTLITSDAVFTPGERHMLCLVARTMIPADPETDTPGADDAAIVDSVCHVLGGAPERTRQALATLHQLADGDFTAADEPRRLQCLEAFRRSAGAQATLLVAAVLQCYYRDQRIMRRLGMEPRPPYPKGYEVEEGDRDLLEPVKARKPFWRVAPE
jgi:hypothetical protein